MDASKMDQPMRKLATFFATVIPLAAPYSTFADILVLDSFDQPAGGQSLTASASSLPYSGFDTSIVSVTGVPGGFRDISVSTDNHPSSSATVTANVGSPGLSMSSSPATVATYHINYGNRHPNSFSLDMTSVLAFRLENVVTTESRMSLGMVIGSSGRYEHLVLDIASPLPGGHVDFPLSSFENDAPTSPVNLKGIDYITFWYVPNTDGLTRMGSFELVTTPEPASATILVAALVGLWAVGRGVVRPKN
jgi:hypothetical protein